MQQLVKQEVAQISESEILNKEDRIFKAWGSVEVRDKEGDLLPMSEFKKIMPIVMKRGGNIMDRHSNRQVGQILNYEFKDKQTDEGPVEGVYLTCQIYKDYQIDDAVWEMIKQDLIKGLSFGGQNKFVQDKFEKGMDVTKVLTGMSGFEFSVVPSMANQEASMDEVNFLAKSNKETDNNDLKTIVKNMQETLKNLVDKMDKDEDNSKTPNGQTLPLSSEKVETFIKNNDSTKPMGTDNIEKVAGQEGSEISKASERLDNIEKMVTEMYNKSIAKEDHKDDEDDEKNKVKKEDHKDEDEEDKEDMNKVKKEGDGEKVILPKVPAEVVQDEDPAEGAETDEIKMVEKSTLNAEVKKQVDAQMADIKKSLNLTKESTPRMGSTQGLINKSDKRTEPKTFKDMDKLYRSIRK